MSPASFNRDDVDFDQERILVVRRKGSLETLAVEKPSRHAADQRHKLRNRLVQIASLEDPFPPKPNGMHWQTYWRLEERDQVLERQWCLDMVGWLERTRLGS